MLLANFEHTNRTLAIASDMVVVFDGLKGRRKYNSQSIQSAYRNKIHHVVDSGRVNTVVHLEWLHAAEAMRRVMISLETPLVFVMQEDQKVTGSTVPLPQLQEIVHYMLQHQDIVNSVHFPQVGQAKRVGNCLCYRNNVSSCKHHSTLPLCSTHTFDDQPHLATRDHYMKKVWPTIPRGYRTVTEHHANAHAWRWKGWVYVGPGHCVHTMSAGRNSAYAARTGVYKEDRRA